MDRPGWSGSPVGLAEYSMLGSYKLFRQIAQVSVQIAHDHIATAFHFLISKRGRSALSTSIGAAALDVLATSVICNKHLSSHF